MPPDTALVLVDLQADYLDAPGLVPAAGAVIEGAARLLAAARARGLPVWHVMTTLSPEGDQRMAHWRERGLRRCVAGSAGHAAPAALRPREGERVIDKTVFSPFVAGPLAAELAARGVRRVVLGGVHLHACVRATALDAYQRGLEVRVAADAVASDDPLHAAITRRYLEARAVRFAAVEDVFGELEAARPDVDAAVARARDASAAWAATPVAARAGLLERLAAELEAHASGLARAISEDVGKPIRQSRGEVARAAALLRAGARFAGEGALAERRAGPRSTARRQPHGVLALITPWNNPLAIPVGKLAPALACGNACVLKPAAPGARVAGLLAARLAAAGLPEGVVAVVAGDHAAGAALLGHDGVDAASVTGSEATGLSAAEICARRRVPLQAELGGNNAALVWRDADLDAAAAALAEGAFGFAGQRCTANRRLVVHADVAEPFWGRFVAAACRLPLGDPLDEETVIGPLIDERAARRVRALVTRAAPAAARVAVCGPGDERGGAYMAPVALLGLPAEHELVQEETFGPVAVVQTAGDLDQALALVNGVRHGLAAALFSRDAAVTAAFLARARAGILKLGLATADADAEAPFGGWGASGIGPPEHGEAAREFFSRWQALYRAG